MFNYKTLYVVKDVAFFKHLHHYNIFILMHLYTIINFLQKIYKLKESIELPFSSLYFLAWDILTFQRETTRKRLIKAMKYRSNIELLSSIYYSLMGMRDFDCETQNIFMCQISPFFIHLHAFISHFSIYFDMFSF